MDKQAQKKASHGLEIRGPEALSMLHPQVEAARGTWEGKDYNKIAHYHTIYFLKSSPGGIAYRII